jgi:hypothetical protein
MRKIHTLQLSFALVLLTAGFVLGGTFAGADPSSASSIEVTTYDEVIDLDGEVLVESGQGFVAFPAGAREQTKVAVRGWDALTKKGLLTEGSTVRVTGAVVQGKAPHYRGHVTVLK